MLTLFKYPAVRFGISSPFWPFCLLAIVLKLGIGAHFTEQIVTMRFPKKFTAYFEVELCRLYLEIKVIR